MDRLRRVSLALVGLGLLLLAGVLLAIFLRGHPRREASPPPATTTAPPPATATAPPSAGRLGVTAVGPFSATVEWTGASSPERVAYGVPELGPTLWAQMSGSRATLSGLRFSTTYRVWAGDAAVDLTTGPPPDSPVASIGGGAVLLDGAPFFPLMVWSQCPDGYASSLAAGINLFAGNACGGIGPQTAALAGRALSATLPGEAGIGGPGVIGWFYPDEADAQGATAATLPRFPSAAATGRLRFLTLSNHVYSRAAPLPRGRGAYPGLVAQADVVGFDLYPLQEWCRAGRLADDYTAQQELVRLARGRPTFQWIEASTWRCPQLPVTAQTVRAEAWLAIAGGARGLGFFPAEWGSDVAGAIAGIARDVAALGPALLAPDAPATVGPVDGTVKVAARAYGGALYVIAANAGHTRETATVRVPGLGGRALAVLGAGRQVQPRGDVFVDSFAPLEVRLYVAPPR